MDHQASILQYRKRVLMTIEELTDTVTTSELCEKLCYLHINSWDEVVEERYLNKTCGLPVCDRSCRPQAQKQMYHIDRKSKKIFENCKQRDKFCSDVCFENSSFIRQQLSDEALWITGENERRMNKQFEMPSVDENAKTLGTKSSQALQTRKSPYPKPKIVDEIQVVEDPVLAKYSDLRIRDEESESEKEADEEEDEELKHVQKYERTEEDDEFITSVQRFMTTKPSASSGKDEKDKVKVEAKTPEKKCQKPAKPSPKTPNDEEDVLKKLREKYGSRKTMSNHVKRGPMIIEPPTLSTRKVKEIRIGEKIKVADDGWNQASTAQTVIESMEERPEQVEDISWIKDLLRMWITDDTKKIMREGIRPPGGEIEKMLIDYLHGRSVNTDQIEIQLPELDKFNVNEKRLTIFMQAVRQTWLDFEARIQLRATRRTVLSRLASTFRLSADNVTGWSKKETRMIVCVMFLAVCIIDPELGDEYCQKDHISPELATAARDFGRLEEFQLEEMYDLLKELSKSK